MEVIMINILFAVILGMSFNLGNKLDRQENQINSMREKCPSCYIEIKPAEKPESYDDNDIWLSKR